MTTIATKLLNSISYCGANITVTVAHCGKFFREDYPEYANIAPNDFYKALVELAQNGYIKPITADNNNSFITTAKVKKI